MMPRRPSIGPEGAELDLTESRVGEVRIVTARGEVDLSTSERFGKLLQRVAAEPGGPIVIGLTACAFIDSSGLAAILHAAGRRDGFSIAGGRGRPPRSSR